MDKHKIRNLVRNKVKQGAVEKPSRCSRCLKELEPHLLEAHHPDYNKPLDVIWLCDSCHRTIEDFRGDCKSRRVDELHKRLFGF